MDIRFEKREVLKEKPDQDNLGFGKYMTDYMFIMDWTKDEGWHDARIVPEGPITLDPACVTLHYAQETFEGLKAYRREDGQIQLFRPEMNARRMINSNARLFPRVLGEMSEWRSGCGEQGYDRESYQLSVAGRRVACLHI